MKQDHISRGAPKPARFALADAVLDRLPTDGFLQTAIAALLLAIATPWLGLPTWGLKLLGLTAIPATLVATVMLALRADTERIYDRFELRFWQDLQIAARFLAAGLIVHFPALWSDSAILSLLSRGLLFISYAMLLLASETQPHREGFWRSEQLERHLSLLTVGLLGLGLFGYFAVTPALVDGRLQDSIAPLAFLFTVFSALISARFLSLGLGGKELKWRSIYRVLALGACASMFLHALRTVHQPAGSTRLSASLFCFLIACALAALVVAVRLRRHPFPDDWKPTSPDRDSVIDPVEESRLGLGFRTLLLALGVPLLHFLGYRGGIFAPAYQEVREIWMLFWAASLGGLAFAQQHITGGRLLSILTEQRRIQRTLAAGERRLKVVSERRQTDEALYYSREKYAKAFRTGPYALAVMTQRDGRHLDANEAYLKMLDLDSKDLHSLRFPDLIIEDEADAWRKLNQQMRRQGSLRDFELRLMDGQKREHRVVLSAESLKVDGEDCYVAIYTDLSQQEDRQLKLQTQYELLQSCTDPAVVIDTTGRLIFSNPAAAQALGWTDETYVGRSAFGHVFELGPELTAANLATKEGRNWMGRLLSKTPDGSTRRLDCWWMPLNRDTTARQDRLILVVAG